MTPTLIADFDRFSQRALMIGAAALALCGVGWFLSPDHFYRAKKTPGLLLFSRAARHLR